MCDIFIEYQDGEEEDVRIRDLEQAIAKFREIPGWKDSQEQIYACEKRITEIKADQERRRLEKERQDELARIAKERRIQKTKKLFKIATPITAGVIVCILLMVLWIIPTVKFNNAVSLMEEGKYGEARSILTTIDYNAFSGCSKLTTIVLPNTLKSIGNSAFSGCSSLTKIIIPINVTSMETAFSSCSNLTIYCRATMIPSGWNSNWNGMRPVTWGYTGN